MLLSAGILIFIVLIPLICGVFISFKFYKLYACPELKDIGMVFY